MSKMPDITLSYSSLRRRLAAYALFLACGITVFATSPVHAESDPEGIKFFENKIRPILIEYCIDCHGEDSQESDLRMDNYSSMLEGGISGPLIVPGSVDESLLLSVIQHLDSGLKMPPDEKMPVAEIELLKEWVAKGAPHPESNAPQSVQPRRGKIDYAEARQYWAFKPPTRPAVPEHPEHDWVKSPIDAFVLEQLHERELAPVEQADKRTLIRRATFDLIGLPPSASEVDAFLADDSADAFEKVIDRLLASPRYGEHWGRYWLNVTRYADSNGLDENVIHFDAWRYRDYVIDSFNNDKPYDRFVMEQLAGDLLYKQEKLRQQPDGSWAPIDDDFQTLIATGFLVNGPKTLAEQDVVKMEMDIIDEQIDTIGQSMLGLTIACARCHDHKFDPISADDYYALAGILKSTSSMQDFKTVAKYQEQQISSVAERAAKLKLESDIAAHGSLVANALATATQNYRTTHELAAEAPLPENIEELFSAEDKETLVKLRTEQKGLEAQLKPLSTAMGVKDGTPTDLKIHVRGSHLTQGRLVARGIPEVLKYDGNLRIPSGSSGRLELAHWIASPSNPLTSRVIVNRIWGWHFGRPLVNSPDNFGRLGDTPTHPELLDWLASEFSDNGWSFKAMHKLIMLSNTYQLSTHASAQNELVDLENDYHWRANVQRLTAEEIRDSLLSVSGRADFQMGGTMLTLPKWGYLFDHTSKDGTSYENTRRSIYQPIIRNNLLDLFTLFDYANAEVTEGKRNSSTVATQALFLMNSPLLLNSSLALAEDLTANNDPDIIRVERLYQRTIGRLPTEAESERFLASVNRLETLIASSTELESPRNEAWAAAIQSLLVSNEFLYLN